MRRRTRSRECALQILYNIDISNSDGADIIEAYWEGHQKLTESREFADKLVKGVVSHGKEIDETISKYAQNWKLARMAVVDRNILRLSALELLFLDEIPPKVSINEAVNLAKKFSTSESGKFVNGILDKIHKEKNVR